MQTIITQGFTLEQFIEAMRPVIRHELAQLQGVATAAQQPTADSLLTMQQAADMLDVCAATLHEWKRNGTIPFRKVGGRVYFNRADVLSAGSKEQRSAKPSRTRFKAAA